MVELNPDHPTTSGLHNEWHKILVLVMLKMGVTEVVLTEDDVRQHLQNKENAVMAHDQKDGLHISVLPMKEAQRLASRLRWRTKNEQHPGRTAAGKYVQIFIPGAEKYYAGILTLRNIDDPSGLPIWDVVTNNERLLIPFSECERWRFLE